MHPVPVPLVDLGLQLVARQQQLLVLRGEVGDDLVHARPEAVRIDAGAGQGLVVHEVVQHPGDAQVAFADHRSVIVLLRNGLYRPLTNSAGPGPTSYRHITDQRPDKPR